ncbi:helix-turn-helix domain-containing protein [Jeotgalibaca porci]|uniref:helix-turn-helix domain-containing protein n=1 Tax=Jeotgalibaca porci TaxID=1868793 RepID=UPI0035A03763
MNIEEHRKITGVRIKELRESRSWSKAELANRLGMKSYTSVTKWENGSNLPRGFELIKFAEMFDVSTDYILGLSNDRK